ncbi:uncharacterized protein LOC114346541 [Diabrotica virgifera virgifera]|uniref:Uncharacterized protein LOC114346541 n=1 Tax=Diabrotica virgifera virgifera TaxID=50390 RepID=A0A6P7H5T9_DIAVI|nr:uncharacterized protein LOC114346541 [Diabrotica virgifera virgifera]
MSENETLILFDFKDNLTNETFEKETFIRVANLHKKNPLVQINDTIFQGEYDHAMGTNLFFEEIQDVPPVTDPFFKRNLNQYGCTFHGIKTINLKQMKIPPPKVEKGEITKDIEFNLDWDYNTLLQKFSNGALKLHDIINKEDKDDDQNEKQQKNTGDCEAMEIEEQDNHTLAETRANIVTQDLITYDDDINNEQIIEDIVSTDLLHDYEKLRKLAFRPVKRKPVLDEMAECDPKYKDAYDYHNLEKQILQPCDFFFKEPVNNINEETLSNCVDVDRCVLYGILEKSATKSRVLTKEEKRNVLSLDNFDNLSMVGRYFVLKTHVESLEKYFEGKNVAELNRKDKYGRTSLQTLDIYKRLSERVKNRIEEIKSSLDERQIKVEVRDEEPGPSTSNG